MSSELSSQHDAGRLESNQLRIMKSKSKKLAPAAIKSGDDLRKYRVALGMTQKQFAEHLDVSSNYVAMLERGDRLGLDGIKRRLRLIELVAASMSQ